VLEPSWLRAFQLDEPATLAAIPEYPVDALSSGARALVRDASRAGLAAALVGGACLAAMATAIGSGSEVEVLSNERPLLWVPLIAPAGAGKSPALALAFGPLRMRDAQLGDDDGRLLLADLMLEALARELDGVGDAAALDLDELATFLRGLGEYKRGGGGDRGRFLQLWSGARWSPAP